MNVLGGKTASMLSAMVLFSAFQAFSVCTEKIAFDGEQFATGGSWGDAAGKTTLSVTTSEKYAGTSSLQIAMSWVAGYYGAAWGWNWANWSAGGAIDVSEATALEMWAKADKSWPSMVLWFTDAGGISSGKGTLTNITTSWQKYSFTIAQLTNGYQPDLTKIWEVAGDTHSNPWGSAGSVTVFLDDIKFVCGSSGSSVNLVSPKSIVTQSPREIKFTASGNSFVMPSNLPAGDYQYQIYSLGGMLIAKGKTSVRSINFGKTSNRQTLSIVRLLPIN